MKSSRSGNKLNIKEWQDELDKGLGYYIKKHGLLHEEYLKVDDFLNDGSDLLDSLGGVLKNLGLVVLGLVSMVVLFVFYIPVVIACYKMEKKEIVKAREEVSASMDRIFPGKKHVN